MSESGTPALKADAECGTCSSEKPVLSLSVSESSADGCDLRLADAAVSVSACVMCLEDAAVSVSACELMCLAKKSERLYTLAQPSTGHRNERLPVWMRSSR
ncbi:hypothetical protein IW137_005044 [Coemansia sp. RSA 1287]|nr:hypothetical protein IW137_005044 [Coemansia sp. RSA 1287]